MKEEIRKHLNDPRQLEMLYRNDKTLFKQEFSILYPELKGSSPADFWHERLHYEADEINWGSRKELLFVLFAAIIGGIIAKFPAIFNLDEEFFYPRNIGFIVFPALMAFFAWKNKLPSNKIALIAGATCIGLLFINFLPNDKYSDTLILSCIHLGLLLWSITGFAFVGDMRNNYEKRLGYLKYNGDLVVMSALILISGGIMTGLTINLFKLIGLEIENFYFEYIIIFGLPAVPIVGTWLTQANPQLVSKVSPVIAKIFSPLVLVMLVIYLIAMVYSGKNPYNDREFLLLFNGLLIGVMAIIFFSVAESAKTGKSQMEIWVLFLLSIVTVIVSGIALSAILFRIASWELHLTGQLF